MEATVIKSRRERILIAIEILLIVVLFVVSTLAVLSSLNAYYVWLTVPFVPLYRIARRLATHKYTNHTLLAVGDVAIAVVIAGLVVWWNILR